MASSESTPAPSCTDSGSINGQQVLLGAGCGKVRGRHDSFVPLQPRSLKEAGLFENDIHSLLLKLLYLRGTLSGRSIAQQLKLLFTVIEKQLNNLRNEQLIGYRGASLGGDYHYELTSKGIEQARQRLEQCTYCGAAPVNIENYVESVRKQSLKNVPTTLQQVTKALSDLLLDETIIGQVGQAIRSGRTLFLYGPPGNGKTSIARRVIRAVDEAIWIPRTLTIAGDVIRLFDPSVHEPLPLPDDHSLTRDQDIDERWIRIRRPTIVVGGELSLRHLEATLNSTTGIIEAPVHVKSNCGCLVVDDFGRQRVSTTELLNRWIVPLECGHDYLNLPSGRQLQVPFEQLLIFSTNLQPSQLCDEAFLRRIPYKIQVGNPTREQFKLLFYRQAKQFGISVEDRWFDYLIEQYRKADRPLRFCQANDLLMHIRDYCDFRCQPPALSQPAVDCAMGCYFTAM